MRWAFSIFHFPSIFHLRNLKNVEKPPFPAFLKLAESARGITPRAAHRSGHEPLDSSGSCHPKKAAAFRQDSEFLRLPVDSILAWMTCSLRFTDITPLQRYYEAVRPWPVHRYFRPCGFSTLGLIP